MALRAGPWCLGSGFYRDHRGTGLSQLVKSRGSSQAVGAHSRSSRQSSTSALAVIRRPLGGQDVRSSLLEDHLTVRRRACDYGVRADLAANALPRVGYRDPAAAGREQGALIQLARLVELQCSLGCGHVPPPDGREGVVPQMGSNPMHSQDSNGLETPQKRRITMMLNAHPSRLDAPSQARFADRDHAELRRGDTEGRWPRAGSSALRGKERTSRAALGGDWLEPGSRPSCSRLCPPC
jgi:hypothetical protein